MALAGAGRSDGGAGNGAGELVMAAMVLTVLVGCELLGFVHQKQTQQKRKIKHTHARIRAKMRNKMQWVFEIKY